MRKIKLTKGKFAIVDSEDFEYLNQWNWYFQSAGYAARKPYIKGSGKKHQKGVSILMHRLIMKNPESRNIDHINHNKLDNRKINLRIVTQSENLRNTKMFKTNTSGLRGVCFHKQKGRKGGWVAELRIENRRLYLGFYKDKETAGFAYDLALYYLGDRYRKSNFGVKEINLAI